MSEQSVLYLLHYLDATSGTCLAWIPLIGCNEASFVLYAAFRPLPTPEGVAYNLPANTANAIVLTDSNAEIYQKGRIKPFNANSGNDHSVHSSFLLNTV